MNGSQDLTSREWIPIHQYKICTSKQKIALITFGVVISIITLSIALPFVLPQSDFKPGMHM
jgi:hypothetical protein